MTSVLSKSHQSFLRERVLQASSTYATHPWSFSALLALFTLVDAPGPQETGRRLVPGRIQPGTVRIPTCSRGNSHCGSGQRDFLLL